MKLTKAICDIGTNLYNLESSKALIPHFLDHYDNLGVIYYFFHGSESLCNDLSCEPWTKTHNIKFIPIKEEEFNNAYEQEFEIYEKLKQNNHLHQFNLSIVDDGSKKMHITRKTICPLWIIQNKIKSKYISEDEWAFILDLDEFVDLEIDDINHILKSNATYVQFDLIDRLSRNKQINTLEISPAILDQFPKSFLLTKKFNRKTSKVCLTKGKIEHSTGHHNIFKKDGHIKYDLRFPVWHLKWFKQNFQHSFSTPFIDIELNSIKNFNFKFDVQSVSYDKLLSKNNLYISNNGPMPSLLSGRGRISKYYHLLIDFCVPIYNFYQGNRINIHVPHDHLNRFDPRKFPEERSRHELGQKQIFEIINFLFNGDLCFKDNPDNVQSYFLPDLKDYFLDKSYPGYIHEKEYGFDPHDRHSNRLKGIWSNHPKHYYDKIRDDIRTRVSSKIKDSNLATIIIRNNSTSFHRPSDFQNNVPDLVSKYKSLGFTVEKVDFADMSFEEQVIQSCNSKLLIGQHGAGLSNALFMEKGSQMLEWGPIQFPCFKILAHQCQLKYETNNIQ